MAITLVLSLRRRERLVRVSQIMMTITQQGQAGPAEAAVPKRDGWKRSLPGL
jgi:hypothetical protein